MKKRKSHRLLVVIDDDIYEHIRGLAFHRRTSMNALAREALVEYYHIKRMPVKKKK